MSKLRRLEALMPGQKIRSLNGRTPAPAQAQPYTGNMSMVGVTHAAGTAMPEQPAERLDCKH